MIEITSEQATTIRFQILFGTAMIAVALVLFWAASQFQNVDLRFAFLFVTVMLALTWLRDGLTMMADVFIIILKMRQK
jgi:hypothetical protein